MPLCSLFLRKLRATLRIPVLALVDSDPYGLKILSVYMKVGWVDKGCLLHCDLIPSWSWHCRYCRCT